MHTRFVLAAGTTALLLASSAALPRAVRAQGPLPTEGYRLVDTWTTRDPQTTVPKFKKPGGVDVASDDTVYVADSQLKQAYHLSSTGQVLSRWDVDRAVGTPLDVAVSVDRVYVVGDAGGEVRSRAGALLRTFSATGLKGVAVGPDRRVYLSRLLQQGGTPVGVVEIRDVDANVLGSPWQSTTFPIRSTFGLDVGPDGRVYVAADGAVYVYKDGDIVALLRVRSAIEGPDVLDVSVDDRGYVYAVLGSQAGVIVAWKGVAGTTGDYLGDAVLAGAKWLGSGPGGGLVVAIETTSFAGLGYVANRDDLKGTLQPQRWGEANDTLGQIDAPRRVATGANGDVYIVDRSERVQRWNTTGNPLDQWDTVQIVDVAGGGAWPCYVRGTATSCLGAARTVAWETPVPANGWLTAATGNATRVAVVDLANQQVVLYNRSDGRQAGGFSLAGTGSYVAVGDIAMDDTAIYLDNRSARAVEAYSLTGQRQRSIAVPGEALRIAAAGGYVYALTRDGWIYKYDGAGTLTAAFDAAPADGGPADLAVAANGRVYVADHADTQLGGTTTAVNRILVFAAGGTPPDKLPEQPDRSCLVTVDKRAAPAQVFLGQEVTVRLAVGGSCPPGGGQVDVALIVDQSGSMSGAAIAASQAAAIAFLAELDPKGAQVALVAFSTTANVLAPLTSDLRQVVRAVAKIQAGGTTNYSDALTKAQAELTGPQSRQGVPHIIVMMTDGNPTDRPDVPATVERVKASGLTIYTIGLGTDLDRDLLKTIATDATHFYEAPTEVQLAEIYSTIARAIGATRLLTTGTVVDELPTDMSLVAGSAFPVPDVNGRTLTWRLANVPITGQSLTYRVKPQQPGHRPTNVQAAVDYVDSSAKAGRLVFPVPEVEVVKRTRYVANLPYLTKNRCRPKRADVVLVFDTSGSMLERARADSSQTKLDAAKAAGRAFLDDMALPGDQAAVLSFNSAVTVAQRLTGSRPGLLAALNGLATSPGTRIDLGLKAASAELLSPRHLRVNSAVIILLTDGKPTGTTNEAVVAAANNARALKYQVFTVGIGDADMDLLRQVSGAATRAFYAPSGDALKTIYASIAGQALCD
jgi:Ca-activated chloride channel homolog